MLSAREELEARLQQLEDRFPGPDIPRPEHWGGWLLRPVAVELWRGRANRLHDREHYLLQPDGSWRVERLAP